MSPSHTEMQTASAAAHDGHTWPQGDYNDLLGDAQRRVDRCDTCRAIRTIVRRADRRAHASFTVPAGQ